MQNGRLDGGRADPPVAATRHGGEDAIDAQAVALSSGFASVQVRLGSSDPAKSTTDGANAPEIVEVWNATARLKHSPAAFDGQAIGLGDEPAARRGL